METIFNWSISGMQCLPISQGNANVVTVVDWRCSASYEGHSSSVYGSCPIVFAGGSFTPYENLTQDQVVEWLWSNDLNKDEVESNIQERINKLINPPVINPPLPWSQ